MKRKRRMPIFIIYLDGEEIFVCRSFKRALNVKTNEAMKHGFDRITMETVA